MFDFVKWLSRSQKQAIILRWMSFWCRFRCWPRRCCFSEALAADLGASTTGFRSGDDGGLRGFRWRSACRASR
jgi:hypothetical protein